MVDRNRILSKFNNEKILGKFAGEDNRNPQSISLNDSGPFSINQLVYPEDLSTRADLQHYIVFYVNVRGKTKFVPERTVDVDVSSAGQNKLSGETVAGQAIAGATTAAAAAAGAGSLIGRGVARSVRGSIGARLRLFSQKAKKNVPLVATGAAGGVASLLTFSDTFKVDTPKRITDAIMLPIETIPSASYSMKYGTVDFGMAAGLLGGSSAIESGAASVAAEGLQASIASLGNLAKGIPGLEDLADKTTKGIKFAGKVATNPFREVIFEAINYREFEFNYTFLPKSEGETYNVRRIIDLFKFHMHPELSSGGLFYVYPSEFEMQYYFKGAQNDFIHKMSTCVLTDMSVTYGDKFFSSFPDGSPTEIKMKLKFREIELLTKERIVKGY